MTSSISSNRDVSRQIKWPVKAVLLARSAGHCEFDGCNVDLLEHHVTLETGFFGEVAHIIAFSEGGPRGDEARPTNIHDISNLLFLCDRCHKLVDGKPNNYKSETLREYKTQHEERVKMLTALNKEKTTVLKVLAKIGGFNVEIPNEQAFRAVAPYYPKDVKGHLIDLSAYDTEDTALIASMKRRIDDETSRLYRADLDGGLPKHISVFAFAPIPTLVYLGSKLSNKIQTALFQRHRDTEDWSWKSEDDILEFGFHKIQIGTSDSKVGLVFSVSGKIDRTMLPPSVDASFSIYEILPDGKTPWPGLLRTVGGLTNFRRAYQIALALIQKNHPTAAALHIFPAVPIPIAISIGKDVLPKVTPDLEVYDFNKTKGGFNHVLTVKGNYE